MAGTNREPMTFLEMVGHLATALWLLERTADVLYAFLVQAVVENKTNRISDLVKEAKELWKVSVK